MASTAKKQKVDKDESVDEVESLALENIDSIQNEVSKAANKSGAYRADVYEKKKEREKMPQNGEQKTD